MNWSFVPSLFKRALHLFYIDRSEALVSMAEVGAPFCWCVPLSCFTYIQKCLGLPGSVSELLVCKTLNYISPKIKNLNPNDLKRSRYTLKFKAGNEERKTWRIFLSEPHANAWWNVSPFSIQQANKYHFHQALSRSTEICWHLFRTNFASSCNTH